MRQMQTCCRASRHSGKLRKAPCTILLTTACNSGGPSSKNWRRIFGVDTLKSTPSVTKKHANNAAPGRCAGFASGGDRIRRRLLMARSRGDESLWLPGFETAPGIAVAAEPDDAAARERALD